MLRFLYRKPNQYKEIRYIPGAFISEDPLWEPMALHSNFPPQSYDCMMEVV